MQTVFALCVRNLKNFVRNRMGLAFSIAFPFFFIWIFSELFSFFVAENPISFMLAGIAIATVFDVALRISSSTIDDMSSGFMKEVLVSPVSRLSVAGGQFMSSAVIATLQGLIILLGGIFLGFRITSAITALYIILTMVAVGFVFAGFGLFIASNTKNTQTFQVVSMAITMPMTFLSGAYIPLSVVPATLQYISWFNPLTYAVALFRTISLERLDAPQEVLLQDGLAIQIGDFVVMPWLSAVILLVFGALFLLLSTITFSRTDFSKMSRNAGDYVEW
jgi:ABC-2 type transport system permease protein